MAAVLERSSELHDFIPAVGGGVFGAMAALLLSDVLLEATLSPFFSGCVALLLLFVSVLSAQRAFTIEAVPPPDLLGEEGEEADDFAQLTNSSSSNCSTRNIRVAHYESKLRARKTLYGLSVLCCIGSVCALLLPRCRGAFWVARAPLYCLLGNSLCLVLVLAVADGLNLYLESASGSNSSRKRERLCHVLVAAGSSSVPAEYTEQLYILLCGSLTLGGAFGFFFAVMDGGDAASHVHLVRYRYLCVPLAVLICSLLGVALNRSGPPEGPGAAFGGASSWAQSGSKAAYQQQHEYLQQQQRWKQEAFVDEALEDDTALYRP